MDSVETEDVLWWRHAFVDALQGVRQTKNMAELVPEG